MMTFMKISVDMNKQITYNKDVNSQLTVSRSFYIRRGYALTFYRYAVENYAC